MSIQTRFICCAALILFSLGCEDALSPDVDDPTEVETGTATQPILNGNFVPYPTGVLAAVGLVSTPTSSTTADNCTGTLINRTTVLTAAHCFNTVWPGTKRTRFRGSDGTWTDGTAFVHRRWTNSLSSFYPFDFAVIKLDNPINPANYDNLIFPKIHHEYASTSNTVMIAGFGRTGGNCQSNIDLLSRDFITFTGFQQDSNYVRSSSSTGTCKGDSGGPAFMQFNGEYRIVGIASTFRDDWLGNRVGSRWKPTYAASRWIMELAADLAQPQLIDPNMSGRRCIGYNNTYHSTHVGMTSGQVLTAVPSNLNNQISRVWVSKGYRLKGYDSYNLYGDLLIDRDGFNGEDCNEKGCWHNLFGTTANNRISSMRCSEDLPQNTWGYCVLYSSYNGGGYYSTRNNSTALGSWSNRTKHAWVKNGRTLKLYPYTNYGTDSNYKLNSITLTGHTPLQGSICNAHGCLHDLANQFISKEGIASSLKCY